MYSRGIYMDPGIDLGITYGHCGKRPHTVVQVALLRATVHLQLTNQLARNLQGMEIPHLYMRVPVELVHSAPHPPTSGVCQVVLLKSGS